MFKKLISVFVAFLVFGSTVSVVVAKTPVNNVKTVVTVTKVTPTPSSTPVPNVDSFELFWPMVSGKTMQSKIYFLKTLKEKIRGFFIFGSSQKANYEIFIGIKRMLEAEALIKGNVPDLANKTLDSAISDFDKANSKLTDAKNSSDVPKDIKDEINMRVSNLKQFVNSMMKQHPDFKPKLQTVLDRLNSLTV